MGWIQHQFRRIKWIQRRFFVKYSQVFKLSTSQMSCEMSRGENKCKRLSKKKKNLVGSFENLVKNRFQNAKKNDRKTSALYYLCMKKEKKEKNAQKNRKRIEKIEKRNESLRQSLGQFPKSPLPWVLLSFIIHSFIISNISQLQCQRQIQHFSPFDNFLKKKEKKISCDRRFRVDFACKNFACG